MSQMKAFDEEFDPELRKGNPSQKRFQKVVVLILNTHLWRGEVAAPGEGGSPVSWGAGAEGEGVAEAAAPATPRTPHLTTPRDHSA